MGWYSKAPHRVRVSQLGNFGLGLTSRSRYELHRQLGRSVLKLRKSTVATCTATRKPQSTCPILVCVFSRAHIDWLTIPATASTMSGSTKWREEQVLVICPGSSTTMAQLGCSELTPPSKRFPTRMFWDADAGFWRPYRTYTRKKKIEGAVNGEAKEEEEIVEDPDSTEGAVYPLRGKHFQCSRALSDKLFLSL